MSNDRVKAALEELEAAIREEVSSDFIKVLQPQTKTAPKTTNLGARAGRRTNKQIQKTKDQIVELLGRSPGLRAEEISAQLGLTAEIIRGPMKKLATEGTITGVGVKRATEYSLAKTGTRKMPGSSLPGRHKI